MSRRLLLAASLVTPVLGGGCGTVCNLVRPSQEDKTFGGVKFDIDQATKLIEAPAATNGPLSSPGEGVWAALAVLFVVAPFADLPLSFVGDVLTFPLTRWIDDERAGGPGREAGRRGPGRVEWWRVTVRDVEERVDNALPVGTPRKDIEAWLASQGVASEYSDLPYMESATSPKGPDTRNYGGTVIGTFRDTDPSPFGGRRGVGVVFLLDADGRLAKRIVRWVNTGP